MKATYINMPDSTTATNASQRRDSIDRHAGTSKHIKITQYTYAFLHLVGEELLRQVHRSFTIAVQQSNS